MPRAYTAATVGFALNADPKWVDNVLSHFSISGVTQSRQGVARRIAPAGVFELALTHQLQESLHIPVEIAVSTARALANGGELAIGGWLSLYLNREQWQTHLETRLEHAVEATPVPRRGRPPGKPKRGA